MSEELSAFLERFHDYQHRTWAGALPTERDALAATFEVLELDKWYSEDEIRCEARHLPTQPPCSGEVAYRIRNCWQAGTDRRVCAATGEWVLTTIAEKRNCNTCGEPTATHWHVWPI